MHVFGYVRTATTNPLRISQQRAALEQWATDNRIAIDQIYEDFGVSGTAPPMQRQGFSQLVAACRATGQDPDVLVLTNLDRISRRPQETAAFINGLRALAVTIRLAEEDF
jgi:DNA invertase Pin-like site-specific DNA recombinase